MATGAGKARRTRVELHVHLDGSIRHETVWELLREKRLPLPGDGSFRALREALVVREPVDLGHFLAPFGLFLPAVQDDLKAIERVAYEFCEDKARQHVLYAEARYSPHAFLTPRNTTPDSLGAVIGAVHRGLQRGAREFEVKVGAILCTLIGNQTAREVLRLFQEHRDKGLVGLDVAALFSETHRQDEVPLQSEEAAVFQEARRLGIHRTVHAGERGGAEMVRRAVEVYGAERVGHGYRVLEDGGVYRGCLERGVHFECCPWSSLLTGAVPLGVRRHPVAVFAGDGASFSVSTDDPTVTGHELGEDYRLAGEWGLTEGELVRANVNAVRASFLGREEKEGLLRELKSNLGL